MSNNQLENIIFNFQECFDGEPWYGISVMAKLRDIDWRTVNEGKLGSKSVAVLLKHMINWRIFVIKKLQGDEGFRIEINGPLDWSPIEIRSTQEWDDLIGQLKSTQEEIVSILGHRSDEILDQKVPGKNINFRVLLEGINHHDIYHLGQIGILNSMKRG